MPKVIQIEVEIKEGENYFTAEQAEYIKRSIENYEYQKKRGRENAKKRYQPRGVVGRPKKLSPAENSESKSE
jgi:hypothetical protein